MGRAANERGGQRSAAATCPAPPHHGCTAAAVAVQGSTERWRGKIGWRRRRKAAAFGVPEPPLAPTGGGTGSGKREKLCRSTHSQIEMAESLDVAPDDANGSAAVQIEPSHEDVLCHDLDSMASLYDEVIAGLNISKFMTDTVMMGILADVQQEAAWQIASKDADIASLNQKVQQLENSSLILHEGRDKRYDEFYYLREQLDTISKSLLSSEWGFLGSQLNSEGSEDASKQRSKEKFRNGVAKKICSEEEVFADPKLLKHMDNDNLIAYFNKSMNEMKRQHDTVVHGQTEEIFKLKRDLLKKEGPNPWHLRNNKELEHMRKKIGEVLSKLDVLLLENKRTFVRSKIDAFPGQHDKNNVVDSDVMQLQGGATNNEEPWSIPTQAPHVETDHKKHIIRLESDIEDASTAATIREEVEKIVMKEFFSEMKIRLHGYEMELDMKHEVCSVIQNEAVAQAMFDSLLLEKKGCAEEESKQKQKIENLKRIVDSFTEVVRKKEEFVSQIGLRAMEARVGSLCHEIDLLREKVGKQDSYISEKNKEFDIIMGRLEQAQQHVQNDDAILSELNDRFRTVSASLKELEKQNQVLHTIIEEKEKGLTSAVSKDKELNEFMESVVKSVRGFEKFMSDQLTVIANKVQHNESRFCVLKEQCKHLVKEGNLLRKKALRYKEISETRGSNLQKAELEVDLLGDEVEALTDLLAKVYIALDHYSPVLQHYTGVMETLTMIKKHISMAN
ncbi:hypothetical protein SEVIR_6G074200v4 [Setaria viridis]|uniref:WPP domain-associated protein n=2 Tax=Setaria viridis TaxID=4556 RepID=A0A4U6U4R9_SETVI|nr:WPP domain-associated protein-like isoform X1 [Setaria viridis]TKW09144.1 hypothetical protein SEVIR_6G074200v2 [Setaria viridis]